MATEALVNDRAFDSARAPRVRRGWRRPLAAGVAIALVGLLAGDRGAQTANLVQGIDPLEILDLEVKPNVLFVVDSSSAMGLNPNGRTNVGGDDPLSRFYGTKQALRELIADNDGKANFGIIDLNADQTRLALNDVTGRRGPLIYVSTDQTGSATGSPAFPTDWADKFDTFGMTFASYDGDTCVGQPPLPITNTCSNEIFRSFRNNGSFQNPTLGRFYMASRLFRNGVRYTFDSTNGNVDRSLSAIDTAITCPPPLAGLLGDDVDEFNDGTESRACFQLADSGNGGRITTYYLTSPVYEPRLPAPDTSAECDGTNGPLCVVAPVTACTAPSNATALRTGPLRLQLPLVANPADPRFGLPIELLPDPFPNTPITATAPPLTANGLIGLQPNATGGMQTGTRRPLLNALRAAAAHYAAVVFPSRPAAVAGRQRNFVIVIASGADDTGATAASVAAQASAMRGASATPAANDITTMVVSINGAPSFPGSADHAALNQLQSAGTLGRHANAFGAATLDELRSSLNFAFSEAIAAGIFSTESSITESIFEYAAQANTTTPLKTFDPFQPGQRYGGRVPTLLQSSFDMPGFVGHLRAFQTPGVSGCPAGSVNRVDANGRTVCEVWDAGEKLRVRVWEGTATSPGLCPGASGNYTTCTASTWTFEQLRGSGPQAGSVSAAYPQMKPATDARLQRRILTTARQGIFHYQTNLNEPFGPAQSPIDATQHEQCPVPLWPPTATNAVGSCTYASAVSPNSDAAGLLDDELGISGLSLAELQSKFSACLTTTLNPFLPGHPCIDPSVAVQTARARREARETILAYMAGAQQAQTGGFPVRCTTGCAPGAVGDIKYQARFWSLSESTLGVPAVVPPPLQSMPITHTAEYTLYRDGLRDSAGFVVGAPSATPFASGFALRNPDRNAGPTLSIGGTANDGNFEPLMTVVYHAANDMLHAFRGGPCPTGLSACPDRGGEELWGFVPYDQLEKLQERMLGQGRSPHTFMMANSVRFSDVFVPGNWTQNGRSFLGRWRTVMVSGRGIAGRYYTALDITSPGVFTTTALDTLPPFAIWSRGNPDTQRGVLGGSSNGVGTADYAKMGQTWSVPAMAAVKAANFGGSEFVMFMGSGYASDPTNAQEGKIFYAVDALTGDVRHALAQAATDTLNTCSSIEPGETCPVRNALVANAAAYIPIQLQAGFVGNSAASTASLVYIGDLHGRMWKFLTNSTGLGLIKLQPDLSANAAFGDSPDQPIGTAVALLNLRGPNGSTPHVYWETGADRRVIAPPPFKFVAMEDVGADENTTIPGTGLFTEPLSGALLGFRGTTQPATAFNATELGRVFFVGTKFTDRNVAGGDCASRFDSVLFALGAVSGGAVFDLDSSGTVTSGDKSIMVSGKVNAIRGSMGQIVLDKGDVGTAAGGVMAPPAPPAPAPAPTTNEGSSGEVFVGKIRPNSNVCR